MMTIVFMMVMFMYFSLVYGMVAFLASMIASTEDKTWLEESVEEKKSKQIPRLKAASHIEPVAFRATEYEIENM